ncbi:MAG: hypothetical protein V3S24_08080 [Candidatus Tectomicrobia bacterium]
MMIEAVQTPITYRWPGGKIRADLSRPAEFAAERVKKRLPSGPGKVRAVLPDGPRFHLGDQVTHVNQDGRMDAGEVQGLTRVEPPALNPGYRYLIACSSREAWVHESLIKPVPTAGHKEEP